ncbi:snf7 family protein [Zymoseptoria brevis]|uniref:Snf7 family protein n=1 Tax=Zymoseptoria brevis TaxID=1047168 RepID=A0A0F4G5J2_9PEZI|nr:snf7 family protein [Zymoseptoria brevis]
MGELLEFLRTHEEAFPSLYSDFRTQRQTNPDGYTANSSAWLRALSSAAKAGLLPSASGAQNDRFVLSGGEELLRKLEGEYGRPLALSAVLQDAIQAGALVELRTFLNKKESVYKKRWVPTVGEVVGWGLRQLGVIGDSEDKLVKGNFVVVANVEVAAKTVLDTIAKTATSPSSRIFSREMFANTFGPHLGVQDGLSSNDLSVLMVHLARDRQAISYHAASGTIKFASHTEPVPSPVTEEDISIASLRSLIASLSPQIDHLTDRIAASDKAAREAVSKKQLHSAKLALRQKKAAETKLNQRTATLTQLEDIYAKIEQASDQVEIVKIMEASGAALKSLNKQTGGVERVQDVMDGLREEMVNADEISNAINEVSSGEIDEGEVEDELEALEKVEKDQVDAKEKAEKDRQEEAEREERQKKELEEAEQTRLKLAELESLGTPQTEVKSQHTVMKETEQSTA